MALKMKINAASYTLYCPAVKLYTGGSHPQYVYTGRAGFPDFANFPRPTCMFESVEKAQAKIEKFIDKAEAGVQVAIGHMQGDFHRFIETAEWEVKSAQEKLELVHTFQIVKLDVTAIS